MSGTAYGQVPGTILENDELGREERSRRAARKAFLKRTRGQVGHARISVFKPPDDVSEISVNRMGFVPDADLADIGIRNSAALGRSFWGWYVLLASDIEAVGCTVKASPLVDNPYHADIVLPVPLDAEDRRAALVEYAKDLADRAVFRPWGDWVDGNE